MRNTGITRKVDELGRVVIPIEIRRSRKWEIGDKIAMYTQGRNIVLYKVEDSTDQNGGIIRKLDELGRMVLPRESRKKFEIEVGDEIEIYTDNAKVILKKYCDECIFCGSKKGTNRILGIMICRKCGRVLKEEIERFEMEKD